MKKSANEKIAVARKIAVSFAVLAFALWIAFSIIGSSQGKNYLIFIGLGIFLFAFVVNGIVTAIYLHFMLKGVRDKRADATPRTAETEAELLNNVNTARTRTKSYEARAEYYDIGSFAEGLGFRKGFKEEYRKAPLKDKLKLIAIYGSFAFLALVGMVGLGLRSVIGNFGYIVFGIGFGGFFAVLLFLGIGSDIQRRRHQAFERQNNRNEYRLHTGTVEQCAIHSQHVKGKYIPKISGTLYQIHIKTDDGKLFWATSSDFHKKGKRIYYYEHEKYRNRRYIASEIDNNLPRRNESEK